MRKSRFLFNTFALTSRYEGLLLAVVKALTSGTPVVEFLSNGMIDLNEQFQSVLGARPGIVDEFVSQLVKAMSMLVDESDVLEAEAEYVRKNLNRDRMYEAIMDVYASQASSSAPA